MSQNVIIAQSYFNAIAKGDFDTVRTLFADDVVWHQPGEGVQSGTYKGMDNVFNHLGNFMKWSNGTFAIDNIEYTTDNGDLVLASIHFEAEKANRKLSMKGVDLLRIEGKKIKEVWLFSENIQEEDDFWNHVANN